MAVPISKLSNKRLLITKPFFEQLILESILDDPKDHPAKCDLTESAPLPSKILNINSKSNIIVTNELSDADPESEVIFYHPISGLILAYQNYYFDWGARQVLPMFSTMSFIENLRKAEASPNVVAHFVHINSGGGEAWMLDIAADAMRACKKPIYAFVEQYCCSAAYFLAANAHVLKAFTPFDKFGSIGSMVSYFDPSGYYEKLGVKQGEVYATKSDLKNKKVNDVLDGKPEDFIRTELDPFQAVFENTVRTARKQLSGLPEDDPIFRGETFFASEAQTLGLIDGILPDLGSAIMEAYKLGVTVRDNNALLTNL